MQKQKQNQKLLTLTEAAQYLNVSRHSLYNYVSQRRITFITFSSKEKSRKYQFLLEDLDDFLIKSRIPALPETLKNVSKGRR